MTTPSAQQMRTDVCTFITPTIFNCGRAHAERLLRRARSTRINSDQMRRLAFDEQVGGAWRKNVFV
jgi:hypothetical protein